MKHAILLALAIQLIAPAAVAVPITGNGQKITFTYDSGLLGLYGAPTILNDSIYFTPVDFDPTAITGNGFNLTKSTVNIQVMPKVGLDIGHVTLSGTGSYLLAGSDAAVYAATEPRAVDMSGPSVLATSSALSSFSTRADLLASPWSATTRPDFDTAVWLPGEGIKLTIGNILLASSINPNSLAYIDKKFPAANFMVNLSPVPEANNRTLLLAGIGLIGYIVRRRNRDF